MPVSDCAFKPSKGTRFIHYNWHIKMMAAAQPFISGAISKTVNLPESATVDEITEVYIESWKLGLKAVAVYRDGCKKSQPLSAAGTKTALSKKGDAADAVAPAALLDDNPDRPPPGVRHRLQGASASHNHHVN